MSLILRSSAQPAGNLTTGAAYASGNVVGGLITFNAPTKMPYIGGVVHTVVLRDLSGNNVPYDLLLFDTAPATAQTDKTAVAIAAADMPKYIGSIPFTGIPAFVLVAATRGAYTIPAAGFTFKLAGAGVNTLFGYLVTRGAPTFTGVKDISLDLNILPDQA